MLQGHCRWKGTMNWGKQILCLACFPKKCGNLTKTIPGCLDLLPCSKPNRARGTTSYHLTLHAGNQTRRKSSSTQASSATKHRRVNGVSWARKSLDGAFIPDDRARSNQSCPKWHPCSWQGGTPLCANSVRHCACVGVHLPRLYSRVPVSEHLGHLTNNLFLRASSTVSKKT